MSVVFGLCFMKTTFQLSFVVLISQRGFVLLLKSVKNPNEQKFVSDNKIESLISQENKLLDIKSLKSRILTFDSFTYNLWVYLRPYTIKVLKLSNNKVSHSRIHICEILNNSEYSIK